MRTTWEIFNADGKLLRTCDTIEDMQRLMLEMPAGFYELTERHFVPIPDSADVVCVEKKFRMERKGKENEAVVTEHMEGAGQCVDGGLATREGGGSGSGNGSTPPGDQGLQVLRHR